MDRASCSRINVGTDRASCDRIHIRTLPGAIGPRIGITSWHRIPMGIVPTAIGSIYASSQLY
eukprot:5047734-Pyramimonas_sp.AAC.1